MCFDLDSHPPIPPIAGGALDSERLTLTAVDGNRLTAFGARAAEPSGAGIVILPDVRGLHPYYEELALRFAEHGIDAVAIDWFGRTAPSDDRGDAFEYMPHAGATTWAGIAADTAAGVAAIRTPTGGRAAPTTVFTIGFCMGGRMSFLAGTLGLGLVGVIGFYGTLVGPWRNDAPAPVDVAAADRVTRPGPVRRRRHGDRARGDRGVRRRADGGRHRPSPRHLPGRAAQLLRPQGRRVRRRERRGLGGDAGLHREADHAGPLIRVRPVSRPSRRRSAARRPRSGRAGRCPPRPPRTRPRSA